MARNDKTESGGSQHTWTRHGGLDYSGEYNEYSPLISQVGISIRYLEQGVRELDSSYLAARHIGRDREAKRILSSACRVDRLIAVALLRDIRVCQHLLWPVAPTRRSSWNFARVD